MTALVLEGFDTYGTGTLSASNILAGPFAAVGAGTCGVPAWGPSRTGINCFIQPNGGEDPNWAGRVVVPTPGTHFFVSFGFAIDQLSFRNGPYIIGALNGSAGVITQLGFTSTGALTISKSDGTVLATTSGPVIVSQNWHFFEVEFDSSSHVINVRVDDAQASNPIVLTCTDASITGNIAQFGVLMGVNGPSSAPKSYMDDLFIRDTNGSVNNSWIGDRRIATLFGNADTATSAWTPSYYKEFGAGILRLSNVVAGTNTIQSPTANVQTNASSTLDLGANDFTLETFVRFDAIQTSSYSSVFSRWDAGVNKRSYRLILGSQAFNNGCLQFDTSTDGTAGTVVTKVLYPWVPSPNTWYHLAIVRAAGELLLFVNGAQFGLPITDSDTYFGGGSEALSIGLELSSGNSVSGTNLIGRLDETRFTNGTGRYTGPFTPPVAAFPRGSADPDWSQVTLLMGYDSGILDESSYTHPMTAKNGAVSFIPSDGPAVGVYSTINKAIPDDNTFVSADLTNAFGILTMTTQPANNDTVTVGTTNGSTPAVYTFKTSISTAFDVLIDTTAQNTLINFLNAVNAGTGSGTKYGTGTTANFDVNAVQLPVGQIEVLANAAGSAGNSIASTSTGTAAVWGGTTLSGGADIPGPTNFKLQRPPQNTTLISAVQMNVRALKTDAGTADLQPNFIGALGGTAAGANHPLTVSARYYRDIFETDPDTMSTITPSTIVNGAIQINRTA